jgi:hypothetical protein
VKANLASFALILIGVFAVVCGTALIYLPAAVILGGILAVGAGVAFLDVNERGKRT